jgi:hypothetical protein
MPPNHVQFAVELWIGAGLGPDDLADLAPLKRGNVQPRTLVFGRVLPEQVPDLVQHYVRGVHVFVGLGKLLREQLLDALVLGRQEPLELRYPLVGCRRGGGFS